MALDRGLMELVREEAWLKYQIPKYTEPIGKQDVKKQYKVSICTNCMGRTEDLKKTYIQNIEDNADYKNTEFVLLNYGSKDDMDIWVFKNLLDYIKAGVLNYYRTNDPEFYSMTHSRNISFKVAKGDVVNNVDADHFTNPGFATRINELANMFPKKAVFIKSRQKNRGRIGMFKKEFVELGGYDESILGYGFDDHDLLMRAYHSGARIVKFGGEFYRITPGHQRHQQGNYQIRDWRYTQRRNSMLSLLNLYSKRYTANEGHHWGKAHLIHNFSTEMDV